MSVEGVGPGIGEEVVWYEVDCRDEVRWVRSQDSGGSEWNGGLCSIGGDAVRIFGSRYVSLKGGVHRGMHVSSYFSF